MSSADGTRGLCPLDSRPSPGRPLMRRAPLAGEASYADSTKGLCPLDSRWGL